MTFCQIDVSSSLQCVEMCNLKIGLSLFKMFLSYTVNYGIQYYGTYSTGILLHSILCSVSVYGSLWYSVLSCGILFPVSSSMVPVFCTCCKAMVFCIQC